MLGGRTAIRNIFAIKPISRFVAEKKTKILTNTRPKTKVKIKPSVVAIYASAFVLIIALVFVGYHQPQDTSVVARATDLESSSASDTSVDEVVATNVAAGVAQTTNLPVATSVANLATSTQAKSEYTQSDGISTTKPQIISSDVTNRSVIRYAVKAGDTVDSLSVQFGISKETIKWANNLTSDALAVDTALKILPINGILYTVKSGDTIDSIATKYKVDKTRLVVYNDLDVSGLTPNTGIILPDGILPENERPGYVAPVAAYNYYAGLGTGFGGSTWRIRVGTSPCPGYGYGYCTCYAYARRVQLGLGVGGNLGNASSWAYYAGQEGYVVNRTPSVGAVMQNGGGLGHVAIVESIDDEGNLTISEMNAYVSGGGWNIVSGRTVPAGNAGQYLYIH